MFSELCRIFYTILYTNSEEKQEQRIWYERKVGWTILKSSSKETILDSLWVKISAYDTLKSFSYFLQRIGFDT